MVSPSGSLGSKTSRSGRRAPWWALVLDVVLVLAFVAIGRSSHDEGDTIEGLATTFWPFLVGMLVGWAIVRGTRGPLATWRSGVVVWVSTVVVGMLLRVVSGQGIAVSFVIVALIVLGVFLVGWRLVARLVTRRAVVR